MTSRCDEPAPAPDGAHTPGWVSRLRLSDEIYELASAAMNMNRPQVDWHLRAKCSEADPELFFPTNSNGDTAAQISEAKVWCSKCEVAADCLFVALRGRHQFGVWGGTSAVDRRRLAFWRFPETGPAKRTW